MQDNKHFWNAARKNFIAASLLCLSCPAAHGQQTSPTTLASSAAASPAPASLAAADPSAQIVLLTDLIHDLQTQVQTLNSQLSDLRVEEQRTSEEAHALRRDLALAQMPPAHSSATTNSALALDAKAYGTGLSPTSSSPADPHLAEPQVSPESDRISKLEENQEALEAKVDEQYQTKVESGSKYRVRLSGMVLLNMYDNRGLVDNQDFPQLAEPAADYPFSVSPSSFGGSLRQSEVKLEAFGPDLFGAHTSANLDFDFAGGFPDMWNGAAMGILRLRTGVIRLDWTNTSIVAGQDSLFFAPLAPTSLATMAIPALSYSGTLWAWMPQVRVEHRFRVSDQSNIELQGGILDSLTGDPPEGEGNNRVPSWGEESGQPAYATRVSWNRPAFGQNLSIGFGGYYARQNWGLGRDLDGWAAMTDVTIPLGRLFEFTGEFYRGRAVAGLGGGIGQGVLLNGSFLIPTTMFKGLDSMGGWAQLKFKPVPKLEINAALGIDNPFAGEMREYQANWIYGDAYSRNLTPLVNFIYQVRSDILFSTEYRHIQSSILDSGSNNANVIDLAVGYIF